MRIRRLLLCFILSVCVSLFSIQMQHFFSSAVHLVCLDCFFSLLFSRSLVPSFPLSLHVFRSQSHTLAGSLLGLLVRSFVRSFFLTRLANIKYSHGRNVCNAHVLLATIYKQKNCLQKTIQNICSSRTCVSLSLLLVSLIFHPSVSISFHRRLSV